MVGHERRLLRRPRFKSRRNTMIRKLAEISMDTSNESRRHCVSARRDMPPTAGCDCHPRLLRASFLQHRQRRPGVEQRWQRTSDNQFGRRFRFGRTIHGRGHDRLGRSNEHGWTDRLWRTDQFRRTDRGRRPGRFRRTGCHRWGTRLGAGPAEQRVAAREWAASLAQAVPLAWAVKVASAECLEAISTSLPMATTRIQAPWQHP